jgi:uncharacterized membrane protein
MNTKSWKISQAIWLLPIVFTLNGCVALRSKGVYHPFGAIVLCAILSVIFFILGLHYNNLYKKCVDKSNNTYEDRKAIRCMEIRRTISYFLAALALAFVIGG